MSGLSSLILPAIIIIIAVLAYSSFTKLNRDRRVERDVTPAKPLFSRKGKTIIAFGIIGIIALVTFTSSIVTISAGTRGVLLTWGQTTGILGEGLHFIIPIAQSVEIVDVRVLRADRNGESAGTKDLQEVTADVSVNYKINPDIVDVVFRTLGRGFQTSIVEPNIDESLKAVTAKFTAEELITQRDVVKLKLQDELQARLSQYDITIMSVSFTDFQFSAGFKAAVDAKVTAQQNALKAQNDLERIRYEQEQKIIIAQAEANATVTKATADARQVEINAQAQANAIKLIQEQLLAHPEYLQYLSIQQWDGKLPYFFGGDVIPFIQFPTNSTSP